MHLLITLIDKGFPTSAVYGFLNSISKILSEESPEYIAITMDTKK